MSFDAASCFFLVRELAFIGGIFDDTKKQRPILQGSPNTWILRKLTWLHGNEEDLKTTLLNYLKTETKLPSKVYDLVDVQMKEGLQPEHMHALAMAEHALLCHLESTLRLEDNLMLPVAIVLNPFCITGPYKDCFQGIPYPLTFGLRHHKVIQAEDGQRQLQPGDVHLIKKLSPELTRQWVALLDEMAKEYRLGQNNVLHLTTEQKVTLTKCEVEANSILMRSVDFFNKPSEEIFLDSLEPTVRPLGHVVDGLDVEVGDADLGISDLFDEVGNGGLVGEVADGDLDGEVGNGDRDGGVRGHPMDVETPSSSKEDVEDQDVVKNSVVRMLEWLDTNMNHITVVVPFHRN